MSGISWSMTVFRKVNIEIHEQQILRIRFVVILER